MLQLLRKKGEKIMIGENITIIVQQIADGRVRLGIEAPAEVLILRKELLDGEENQKGTHKGKDKRVSDDDKVQAERPTPRLHDATIRRTEDR